jgi:hypothetical protein
MRSTTPPTRRHRRRGPTRGFVAALARIVDEATADDPGAVIVHVDGPLHPDVDVAFKHLDLGEHPFEALAGCTAPPSWTAFGIRARGRAHHLDDPGCLPERVTATFVVDRTGAEASLLRLGAEVTEPPGPAVGTIPDVARRVLELPTDPPPSSTAILWTSIWLDRVLEQWGQPHRRRDVTSSWGHLAVLHPAIHAPSPPDVLAFADPVALVSAARSHAASASWADVRRSPIPLALPDGALPRSVTEWMDDGFFARWAVGAFPSIATMATDLRRLLGDPLGRQLLETTAALLE